jgi:hypothetical protein
MSMALSTRGVIPDEVVPLVFYDTSTNRAAASMSTGGVIVAVSGIGIRPQLDYEESVNYDDTIITLYPNGLEQRISTVSTTRRQFNLNFKALTSAELDDLWRFYQNHHGQLYPFMYISPTTGEVYTVRFANKAMSRTWLAYQLEATGLQLIEVLGE